MKHTLRLIVLSFFLITACSNKGDLLVITNINGYTPAGDSLMQFSTLVIKEGKVFDIGGSGIADGYRNAAVYDAEGRTMLPGLTDAHGHIMSLGFQELQVDVTGINSLEETLDKIKAYAEAHPELDWIQGRGWNQTRWAENEFPTAADLDKAVPDRPVWLTRIDGHAGWANSAAIKQAGISKDTPDGDGGRIIRDVKGDASGVFVDAAQQLIRSVVPEADEEESRAALELGLEKMRSVGLTSVHDAGIGAGTWELYKEFADNGKMTARIYAMISGTGQAFDKVSENGPIRSYHNDMLALRSVKLMVDGALGSRGAALLSSYSDEPGNSGLLLASQEEMNERVLKAMRKGFQVNIHAIGDRGNREVLNAFENAYKELGTDDYRSRIEHAQIVSLEDIPRFKELDIIASMQPTHATSDMNMAEDRVGPQRIKGSYAWRTFINQGTLVAGGSDFPIESPNPFYGLYSAVTRQDHEGNPPGGWHPEEAMTREEALRAFTINAAYARFAENTLGSLEKGKWADFIITDRDYFEVPDIEIWQIKVLETWVGGKKVFDAGS